MINKNELKFLRQSPLRETLTGQKIAFLGLGAENLALIKFLLKTTPSPFLRQAQDKLLKRRGNQLLFKSSFTVCDPKSEKELGERWEELKILAKKNDFVICHSDPESSGEESILHKAKLPTNNPIVENRGCRTQDGHRSLAIARDDKRKKIILISGKNYDQGLEKFDIIFRSPGYKLFNKNLIKAKKAGVEITSPMKLFFDLCPTKNIIGVTGSKGKGTTASLIYEILKTHLKAITHPGASRHPSQEGNSIITTLAKGGLGGVWLGGNIGVAQFDFIEKIKPNDFVVLELSSFQLEDLEKSPHIAVITNLFREHLASADPANPNYHKSMGAYIKAKSNIFAHQKRNDWLVVNEKLQITNYKLRINGKIIKYDKSDLSSNLIGGHNQENIAAAEAVAKILKIKPEIVARAVKKFKGLPHRLEFVAEKNGVKYFDDSFATVPEVSVIALKAISNVIASEAKQSWGAKDKTRLPRRSAPRNDKNIILLAGGADKGSDFSQFVKEIKKRVKYLILFKGKGTDKLNHELRIMPKLIRHPDFTSGKIKNYELKNLKIVSSMSEAIKIARSKAKPGDIVLLSTGCASFGCFKNYKDRGEQFKKEVLKK